MRAVGWAGLLALAVTVAGCASTAAHTPPSQHFHSRPDLRPPRVKILVHAHATAPGYLFVAPKEGVDQAGPLILNDDGQVVWFDSLDTHRVANFAVQRYRGRPVLTWWQAQTPGHSGHSGKYVIADAAYRVIATVTAADGLSGDLHEFELTPRNTALVTSYHRVPLDLSPIGGPEHGAVWEGVVQELAVPSGKLLFEWHSLDHVGIEESYERLPKDPSKTYDYIHINSVDVDRDGNLLVSARNTHTAYAIRRRDGAILWRLGGKRSDFKFEHGALFAWQHDVRRQPDGTVTVFDNEAVHPHEGLQSRVIVLRLDTRRHRANLVRSYTHRPPLLATSEGNAQYLPDGHVLVGWGSQPYVTEFAHDGEVLLDLRLGSDRFDSYRAYRFRWTGRPRTRPDIAAVAAGNATTIYASWNGATDVAAWQVLAGPDARHLRSVTQAPKAGFETAIRVRSADRVFQIAALDQRGRTLQKSAPVVAD